MSLQVTFNVKDVPEQLVQAYGTMDNENYVEVNDNDVIRKLPSYFYDDTLQVTLSFKPNSKWLVGFLQCNDIPYVFEY